MTEHRDARVFDRADQPAGLLVAGKAEPRVNGCDHDVERLEEFVAVVDRAVGEDVRFGPVKDPESRKSRPGTANRLPLTKDTVRRQPAGVPRPLAVVGDRRVLVAGRAGGADHLV